MKEKSKNWSLFSVVLVLAVLIQPGMFAHVQQASAISVVPDAAIKAPITFQAPIKQQVKLVLASGNCSASNIYSTSILVPNLQGATAEALGQGSAASLTQNSLQLNPNLSSNCFQIALQRTPSVQQDLAVRQGQSTAQIAVNHDKYFAQDYKDGSTNHQPEATVSFTTQIKSTQNKTANLIPASRNAAQFTFQPHTKNLAQLAVWRC